MLRRCIISTILRTKEVLIKGCPQGRVLYPTLLWSIVVDDLIKQLNDVGLATAGYADNVSVFIVGNHLCVISELM